MAAEQSEAIAAVHALRERLQIATSGEQPLPSATQTALSLADAKLLIAKAVTLLKAEPTVLEV
jgi:hypothetical protein